MNAFATSVDLIFANPHIAVDAEYRVGGGGSATDVRVVFRAPDGLSEFNAGRFVRDSVFIDVRTSEVAELNKGDTFTIGGTVYTVLSEPQRDSERLVWQSEASE